jgi:4-hydroxy-3-polyprenylbenzoate decarboxylase
VAEGTPVDEYHTVCGPGISAEGLEALHDAGLPVSMVWSVPRSATHWIVVTVEREWRTRLPGVSTEEFTARIARTLFASRSGIHIPVVFVLDDDIDPTNDAELLWALATRVHPLNRTYTEQGRFLPLLTCYTAEERESGIGAKVAHDALLGPPTERLSLSSFAEAYPEEIKNRVLARWDE